MLVCRFLLQQADQTFDQNLCGIFYAHFLCNALLSNTNINLTVLHVTPTFLWHPTATFFPIVLKWCHLSKMTLRMPVFLLCGISTIYVLLHACVLFLAECASLPWWKIYVAFELTLKTPCMVFKQASIYAISDFTSPSVFAQKWIPFLIHRWRISLALV